MSSSRERYEALQQQKAAEETRRQQEKAAEKRREAEQAARVKKTEAEWEAYKQARLNRQKQYLQNSGVLEELKVLAGALPGANIIDASDDYDTRVKLQFGEKIKGLLKREWKEVEIEVDWSDNRNAPVSLSINCIPATTLEEIQKALADAASNPYTMRNWKEPSEPYHPTYSQGP